MLISKSKLDLSCSEQASLHTPPPADPSSNVPGTSSTPSTALQVENCYFFQHLLMFPIFILIMLKKVM